MSRYKVLHFIILVLMLTACTSSNRPTHLPVDDNIAFDLLINEADLPPGWISYKPLRPSDDYCLRDCALIQFSASTGGQDRATNYVFVYDNSADAIQVYKTEVEPRLIGEKPTAWTYVSKVADDSGFACSQFKDVEYPLCNWKARYGRCVVEFGAWLVPGKMSLDNLATVIQAIDKKMLSSPCFTVEK